MKTNVIQNEDKKLLNIAISHYSDNSGERMLQCAIKYKKVILLTKQGYFTCVKMLVSKKINTNSKSFSSLPHVGHSADVDVHWL